MTAGPRSLLREGIVAGLIGATVVAVWFLCFDVARGRPFLTPGLLGAAVFQGVTSPIGLQIAPGPVLGYTILHGLAFVAFGVIAASVMAVSEREPTLFVAFVILFACFEVFVFGVIGALSQSMLGALVWWAILVGNLLASIAMLWYLFRAHRALPQALVGSWGGVLREGIMAGLIGAAVVALWFLAIDWIQGEPLRTAKLLGLGAPAAAGPCARRAGLYRRARPRVRRRRRHQRRAHHRRRARPAFKSPPPEAVDREDKPACQADERPDERDGEVGAHGCSARTRPR